MRKPANRSKLFNMAARDRVASALARIKATPRFKRAAGAAIYRKTTH